LPSKVLTKVEYLIRSLVSFSNWKIAISIRFRSSDPRRSTLYFGEVIVSMPILEQVVRSETLVSHQKVRGGSECSELRDKARKECIM
jgi:hypothetical protein